MKRDDELIRSLMIELEADPDPIFFFMPDEDDELDQVKYYHLKLLADGGFLEETGRHGFHFRITNNGHDLLRLMENEGLWAQMKAKAAEVVPAYTLRLLFEVGNNMLRQKLREVGLNLD